MTPSRPWPLRPTSSTSWPLPTVAFCSCWTPGRWHWAGKPASTGLGAGGLITSVLHAARLGGPPTSPSSSRTASSGAWTWRRSRCPRRLRLRTFAASPSLRGALRWCVGRAVAHIARAPQARARKLGALLGSANCASWVARPLPCHRGARCHTRCHARCHARCHGRCHATAMPLPCH